MWKVTARRPGLILAATGDRETTRASRAGSALIMAVLCGMVVVACRGGSGQQERPADAPGVKGDTESGPRPLVTVAPRDLPPLPAPVYTLWVRAGAPPGGDGSAERPFATIGQALAAAQPGDAVSVGPGTYRERVRSVRAGGPAAPIRLVGAGAEIAGDGDGRLVELTHDHIALEGFRLTNADILLWVQNATGVRAIGNVMSGASGECVRLKYFARNNEVAGNRIEGCGREDFRLEDDSKNGEGIYIGTAPEQRKRNPTDDPDDSGANWVHDNSLDVPAECVDVKEDAQENLVEGNHCTGGRDPDGAGFSSRGLGTIFRNNRSTANAGAGIRLGGDRDRDGIRSVVVGNTLIGNRGYGVKVLRRPQAMVCGNTVVDNRMGPTTKGSPDPSTPCA